MPTFPGEFYFKLTVHGNLLGEFTNRAEVGLCTESSVRITAADPEDEGGFTGEYKTTWYDSEGRGSGELANLEIKQEVGKAALRYLLIWKDSGKKVLFHGYGFVCDGVLIGHYVDGAPKS